MLRPVVISSMVEKARHNPASMDSSANELSQYVAGSNDMTVDYGCGALFYGVSCYRLLSPLVQSDDLISFDIMNEVIHSDGCIGGGGYLVGSRGAKVCGCVWDVDGACSSLVHVIGSSSLSEAIWIQIPSGNSRKFGRAER